MKDPRILLKLCVTGPSGDLRAHKGCRYTRLNFVEGYLWKPYNGRHVSDEVLNSFLLKTGNKKGFLLQCPGGRNHCIDKGKKSIKVRKEEVELVELFLFGDDIIVYVKRPKEYTRQLPELISEFSNIVGYNDNIEKLVVFIYTSSKH